MFLTVSSQPVPYSSSFKKEQLIYQNHISQLNNVFSMSSITSQAGSTNHTKNLLKSMPKPQKIHKFPHGPMGYPPALVCLRTKPSFNVIFFIFFGVLESLWDVLGRLGPQHDSKLAPKTRPKSMKNPSQNQLIFDQLLDAS